ncbi:hypothetical protein GF406_03680 [candidate division KSB1 bacterium]|nr:hypothetical protein [candidate division KSB1 bacterium]
MFIHALNSFSHRQVASVQTREDGSFVINDLNPGNYIIEASGMIMDYPYTFQVYAKEYYPDQQDIDKATPVNVSQDVTGIDFQVSYGGGIRGRIIRQWDSQPIPHTMVGIRDTTDKYVVNAVTMTDKEGQFFISGLPKGFVGLL